MKTRFAMTAAILLTACTMPLAAKDKTPHTWYATRTADPVTGVTRCVVTAMDYVGKTRYSRTGFLYPMIENHPRHGLLIGVSSGGRFRLPTGTMLWRVDDQPFREIRPEDGPLPDGAAIAAVPVPAGAESATSKAVNDAMALATRMAAGFSATSTFATGEQAAAMLAELRAGHGLLYRAKAASSDMGLPDSGMYRVGQITKDGLKPIPVDESLHTALAQCGIAGEGEGGGAGTAVDSVSGRK
ncbi:MULTISPECIES: hypothetical protein [unclassified Sphingobium]|uniref:hypothetical protein n=2 Tax=Sphingobium TaxID=165695 RepID=UPI000D1717E3|nr:MULTISPECIES: hypothetical protein [unclassified Sphingobium]TWD23360.1 hypothetical protein FB594_1152 [Sphingobium sp. AEW001]MBG6119027.1 hypothetical protein [Sphingobium sp. JAI105]PSO10638.1 hypothetical protein C7E20_15530 [Sphingobium sp. AEW4]TWD02113.1 hypothetical protein FB595_1152 [Sphingobium sp. AEW010]TWD20632.1 hypothetical protein FB596_1152 [Sphingobium sp. AEW013]